MREAVTAAPAERQLAFLRARPEFGSKVEPADITIDSRAEQGSLGLDGVSDEEFSHFPQLNAAYREKFGFSVRHLRAPAYARLTPWSYTACRGS